jgi:hypothetical protein
MSRATDPLPRVIGARLGANPNSSSMSIDVATLFAGALGSLLVGLVLSALLRGRRPEKAP